jgi:hypothetical protein
MPDSTKVATTSDLGVVEPLRIPGVARARRLLSSLWSDLPPLGRAFVILTVVDIAVRGLGLFGTNLFLFLDHPISWVTAFLPHNALILLPAAIAYRRPNVLRELPLVIRGAIVVAFVELVRGPIGSVVSGIAVSDFLVPVLVSMAFAVLTAAGWIAVGRGMWAFTPASPAEPIVGLATLVAGTFAGAAIGGAVLGVLIPVDMGDPAWNGLLRLNNVVLGLSGFGLAYLAWVVVRGTGDPARPAVATKLATVSLTALGVGAALSLVGGQGPIWIVIPLVTHVAAWTGLVVAFGLGLADPSDRTAPEPVHEPDSGPAWPEPGGATPAFHEPGGPRPD